jgi:hypothetical protein
MDRRAVLAAEGSGALRVEIGNCGNPEIVVVGDRRGVLPGNVSTPDDGNVHFSSKGELRGAGARRV